MKFLLKDLTILDDGIINYYKLFIDCIIFIVCMSETISLQVMRMESHLINLFIIWLEVGLNGVWIYLFNFIGVIVISSIIVKRYS